MTRIAGLLGRQPRHVEPAARPQPFSARKLLILVSRSTDQLSSHLLVSENAPLRGAANP
jgi:hypothetical protein